MLDKNALVQTRRDGKTKWIGSLRAGDLVFDPIANEHRILTEIFLKKVNLREKPWLRPVRILSKVLDGAQPKNDLLLSPLQRLVVPKQDSDCFSTMSAVCAEHPLDPCAAIPEVCDERFVYACLFFENPTWFCCNGTILEGYTFESIVDTASEVNDFRPLRLKGEALSSEEGTRLMIGTLGMRLSRRV